MTLIRYILLGIAFGIFGFAIGVFENKLSYEQTNYQMEIINGIIAFVVFTVVAFLMFFPTEKRVAKKLDGKLELGEKLQTMVEFKEQSGDIITLQREDANKRLSEVPKKSLISKHIWIDAVIMIAAIALLVASIVMPVMTKPLDAPVDPDAESDEWVLDEWHITAVKSLIEEVKASSMQEDGKSSVVTHLETMLSDLSYIKSKSQMKQTVTATMVKISAVTDGINTYTDIIRALKASSNEDVVRFAEVIGSPAAPIVESKLQEFKVSFKKETLGDRLGSFAAALDTAVKSSGKNESDALYAGLVAGALAFSEFDATVPTLTDADYENGLTAVFESSVQDISLALNAQNVNRTTTDNANNRLMVIFDIAWAELPDELKYPDNEEAGTTNEDYEEKEDDIVTGGGLGSGEVIYGSNDAVYDPNKGAHVNYGEVINDYDAQKAQELEERPLNDSMKEAIGDYFDTLYYKQEK